MHEWCYPHNHGQYPRHLHRPPDERIDRFKETAEWRPRYRADYSPHGDTLDMFARKVYAELEMIYHLLNRLRKMDASAGDLADTVAYQLHVDTASGRLLIRDSKNQNWIELGKLDESFFGIEPEDVGAVRNEGIGAFHSGNIADLPKNAGINDIFYALDEKKIFFYSGTSWEVLASLDFADLYGYDGVQLEEVSDTGEANKIVRLDSDGVIHADIDGKFKTARKITISGDAQGEVYFDGSDDVEINLSVSTAQKDGEGNKISETYATKAGLSSFVTKPELAIILEDYSLNSSLSDSEQIIFEDILKLFSGGTSVIIGGDSSAWLNFSIASEEDILELFSVGSSAIIEDDSSASTNFSVASDDDIAGLFDGED